MTNANMWLYNKKVSLEAEHDTNLEKLEAISYLMIHLVRFP